MKIEELVNNLKTELETLKKPKDLLSDFVKHFSVKEKVRAIAYEALPCLVEFADDCIKLLSSIEKTLELAETETGHLHEHVAADIVLDILNLKDKWKLN